MERVIKVPAYRLVSLDVMRGLIMILLAGEAVGFGAR
jgi:predicted acyltransferase